MACTIYFGGSKIMKSSKSTMRPAGRSSKYLETYNGLET